MRNGIVRCWVCGVEIPAELAHQHHKVPRSAKGGDNPSNLVWLDPTCHAAIDRGAVLIMGGKKGRATSVIEQHLPADVGAQKRLALLINTQAASWKLGEKRDTHLITIGLPDYLWRQLRAIVNTQYNPKTKRPLGISTYIEKILLDYVTKLVRDGHLSFDERKKQSKIKTRKA